MLTEGIMALVTHQVQGCYSSFPSRPLLWNREKKLKQDASTLPIVRTDRFLMLRCRSHLSIGALLARRLKGKSFKVLGFKSISQSDESGDRATGSKSVKNPLKLSYLSQDSEDANSESPKVQNLPVCYTSETEETTERSLAIQKLFKKWLILLRMPSSNDVMDQTLEGEPLSGEISETHNGVQRKERGEILKAIWCYFLGLDATIKIPLLIFAPWFLAVNVIYGAEVSKELAPLWVFGPLIVAFYIKMFQALCALYVFSFKQTVKVIKNFPTYCLMAYGYIAGGKLAEDVQSRLLQPLVDIKNLDYKEVWGRHMKDLGDLLVERYLDFVESIWPYYCRTIRFLKRANLI